MSNYTDTIQIDFDVFKGLTALLQSPEETYNSVIRRLLDLPPDRAHDRVPTDRPTRMPFMSKGVEFPHGTEFRGFHKGIEYKANVVNGALVHDGTEHRSPSGAACDITGTSVNGWTFWEARVPGASRWTSIATMRK